MPPDVFWPLLPKFSMNQVRLFARQAMFSTFYCKKVHTGGNIPVFELDLGEVISERLTIPRSGSELAGCVTS